MHYWFFGAHTMFQSCGDDRDKWNAALKSAVLGGQRKDGASKGSWDPSGPWGFAGGRVHSTALGAMCLEVYCRYPRRFDRR